MADIYIDEIIIRSTMLGHQQSIEPQGCLIIFDCKDVISPFEDNCSGNVFLAAPCIYRYCTAFYVNHIK